MVSLGDTIVFVSFGWLGLIALANRIDLTKYHLNVSAGFLLFSHPKISAAIKSIAHRNQWKRVSEIASLPALILFLGVPILLALNLIKGLFFDVTPIFQMGVIRVLRIESFLLVLPPLALFLTIQYFFSAVFRLREGQELENSGILLFGVVFMFFARFTKQDKRKYLIPNISLIVIVNLLFVLLTVPMIGGVIDVTNQGYNPSSGAIVTYIEPNSPASSSFLSNNDIITEVFVRNIDLLAENTKITSATELRQTLAQIPAGVEFLIIISSGDRFLLTGINPPAESQQGTGSYIGVNVIDFKIHNLSWISPLAVFWLSVFRDWLINIGLLFSAYFLLPLPNSGGYQLFVELVEKFDLELTAIARQRISIIVLFLFLGNILFSFI